MNDATYLTLAMHFCHGYYDNNSIVPAIKLLFE